MVSLFYFALLLWQPPTPQGQFFQFGTEHDLFIQESVTAVLRAEDGLMWFGTQRGLVRFDGIDTLHLRVSLDDPYSIPSDNISCLAQTDAGFLWVGTKGAGLFQLDVVTGKRRLWHEPALSDSIWDLAVDHGGRLWVATKNGLWRIPTGGGNAETISPLPTRVLGVDAAGGVWQATQTQGLHYFNSQTDAGEEVPNSRELVIYDVFCQENEVWLAADQGLYRVQAGRLEREPEWPWFDRDTGRFQVARCVVRDHFGTLWVGGTHALWRRAPGQTGFTAYTTATPSPSPLRNNRVNHLLVDAHHQLLWVATEGGGMDTFGLLQDRFHMQVTEAGVSKLMVHDELLWVAKVHKGVARYRLKNLQRQDSLLDDRRVDALYIDGHKRVWFGTSNGLFYLEDGTALPTEATLAYTDRAKNNLLIHALHHDGDTLWLGTNGGLYRRPDKGDGGAEVVIPKTIVTVIRGDRGGRLWIGTYGKGLICLDPASGARTDYRKAVPPARGGLGADTVLDLLIDHDDVWVATHGGGLNHLAQNSGAVEALTMENGYPDNAVTALVRDGDGRIWSNTGIGLVVPRGPGYTTLQRRVERFNLGAATPQAAAVAPDGRLFFGGVRGFVAFDPKVTDLMHAPAVAVTRITRDDESIAIGRPESLFLDQDHQSLEIEWTTIDYNQPRYNLLRAKLGERGEWREERGKYTLRLVSNMSWGWHPGRFPIQLTGINQRGQTTQVEAVAEVADPWWKKWWWALLGSFLVISYGAISAIVQARSRKRRRQLEARARLAEEQFAVAERKRRYEEAARKLQEEHFWMLQQHLDQVSTQIAHDLHDGPLAELSGMGFRLHMLQQGDLDDSVRTQLADVTESLVPRISHELRNVCADLLVPDVDMSLAMEIESFAESTAERYPELAIHHRIAADPDDLAGGIKSTLFRIARTLLQNVAKHAQADRADVTLAYRDHDLLLVVADNGVGFTAPQAWDQLKKEKHYGLYMAHYFANAMGGDLVVHSQLGAGTRIEVTLPQQPNTPTLLA